MRSQQAAPGGNLQSVIEHHVDRLRTGPGTDHAHAHGAHTADPVTATREPGRLGPLGLDG
jgi:hypothetical protein